MAKKPSPEELFNDTEMNINELIDDTDGVVDIPLDVIDTESKNESMSIIHNLISDKYDAKFLDEHPDLKKNIEVEKEGLRKLLKMAKSNETLHDVLVGAIGANANNASLYASLAKMQTTILSIQKQIDEKVENIKKLLKNYQIELNFDMPNEISPMEDMTNVTRGTKDFIKMMQQEEREDEEKRRTKVVNFLSEEF